MHKLCAKIVPKLLNDDQKLQRMQVCKDILENVVSNPDSLKKIITGDKAWVFKCDPETNRQESPLEESSFTTDQKGRSSKSKSKLMLKAFLTSEAWSIMNFCPRVKLSIILHTERFCNVCFAQ